MSLPVVNVTVPVFNEARRLAVSLPKLHQFLSGQGDVSFEIVIADNGSKDGTLTLAKGLARRYHGVRVMHLAEKGRGEALKTAWSRSQADILSYMDVDLATDLTAFPALVETVAPGQFQLAIGSRLLPGSHTERGWKRELLSRGYMRLVRTFFQVQFSDAQCGFKAITREAAQTVLPLVEDTGWFFDTELLVLAERLGYRIGEVPVTWIDDPDSRVRVVPTAWADLKGLLRVRRNFRRGVYPDLRGSNEGDGSSGFLSKESQPSASQE